MSDDNLNNRISHALNVEYQVPDTKQNQQVQVPEQQPVISEDPNLESDFQHSRQALQDLVHQGQEAIAEYMQFAKESQSPRAYEVLAKLIDSTANASKDALELHQKKNEVRNTKPDDGNNNNGMNIGQADNVYIQATTSDFLNKIEDESNE